MHQQFGVELLHVFPRVRALGMYHPQGNNLCIRLLLTIVAGGGSLSLEAGDWQSAASLNVGAVHTDNVCLEEKNKTGDTITTVTPSISLKGAGRRINLDLDGALELSSLSRDESICNDGGSGERDPSNPRLRADADLELVKQFLFVDLSSRVQQNTVDPFRGGGESNLGRSGNINTTYHYQASPYLTAKLGEWARLNLRYAFNRQTNSRDSVDDSDQKTLDATLQNSQGRFSWALNANQQIIDYSQQTNENIDDSLGSVNFSVGYQLDNIWQLNAAVGQDFNDYVSADGDVEGNRWRAGLIWTPNSRTELQLGFGNRFFGNTPELTFKHHRRRSDVSLRYAKTLSYTRDLRLDEVFLPVVDASGNPLQNQFGEPVTVAFNQTIASQSPVVDERLQLAYRLQGRVSVINITALHSKQVREEDNESSRFSRYQVTFDRRLTNDFSVNSRISLSESKADSFSGSPVDESETWGVYLGLTRKISHHSQLSVNYAYTDRQSDLIGDNYTENRVTASIGFSL